MKTIEVFLRYFLPPNWREWQQNDIFTLIGFYAYKVCYIHITLLKLEKGAILNMLICCCHLPLWIFPRLIYSMFYYILEGLGRHFFFPCRRVAWLCFDDFVVFSKQMHVHRKSPPSCHYTTDCHIWINYTLWHFWS